VAYVEPDGRENRSRMARCIVRAPPCQKAHTVTISSDDEARSDGSKDGFGGSAGGRGVPGEYIEPGGGPAGVV